MATAGQAILPVMISQRPGAVTHASDPSTPLGEAGDGKFETYLGYTAKSCLRQSNEKTVLSTIQTLAVKSRSTVPLWRAALITLPFMGEHNKLFFVVSYSLPTRRRLLSGIL